MNPLDAGAVTAALVAHGSPGWAAALARLWPEATSAQRNADLPRWLAALAEMPAVPGAQVDTGADTIRIGRREDLDDDARARLAGTLMALHPWRKGPFDFFGLHIDTEWRSDWKWQRVAPHLSPLAGRRVLDVGCGSGYHALRMHGAGAAFVLGIEPALLYLMQFAAVKRYAPQLPVFLAPVKLEDLPPGGGRFDTVLSMGVLYHRRSPLDHLAELREALVPGGELVLETLVVEGDADTVLLPPDRYAQMRNVYFLPSTAALERWLLRCGLRDVRLVDTSTTTTAEQRRTDWMHFQSLADFLDPADPSRTVEGHPAPRRATFIARRPA